LFIDIEIENNVFYRDFNNETSVGS
jgi:hypothetical protein